MLAIEARTARPSRSSTARSIWGRSRPNFSSSVLILTRVSPDAVFQPPADGQPDEGPFAALGVLKKGRDGP